jgi:site-specific DNA-methyltransferase (adenine-specific)
MGGRIGHVNLVPYWQHERATLYAADALAVLASLPEASVDAVITDPPYSSGGMVRGDRMQGTHLKYLSSESAARNTLAEFSGDNRDQRAYAYWCALWLGECLRVTKPGGTCLLFTDWRQLPVTSDALQAGGWVWRGIVPWAKINARPQLGRFSAQCEYVVWGSARGMPPGDYCLPGFYQSSPVSVQQREHSAQKPLAIMRSLVKIAPPGGVVLDPFMGAGTTGVAAITEGRDFTGSEQVAAHQRTARERIEAAIAGYRDKGAQMALV